MAQIDPALQLVFRQAAEKELSEVAIVHAVPPLLATADDWAHFRLEARSVACGFTQRQRGIRDVIASLGRDYARVIIAREAAARAPREDMLQRNELRPGGHDRADTAEQRPAVRQTFGPHSASDAMRDVAAAEAKIQAAGRAGEALRGY
jgi:hypothetical protein